MKAKTLTLIASLTLAGCASQSLDQSPAQTYRASGSTALWTISGDLQNTAKMTTIERNLIVKINGETVINGAIARNGSGLLNGKYQGKNIESDCSGRPVSRDWIEIRCMILVDNERAATLTF